MEQRRIRELRIRLGLSQERFARRLDVSFQTVRRWEGGLTKPLPIIGLKLDELQKQTDASKRRVGGMSMRTAEGKGKASVEIGLGGVLKGVGSLLNLVAKMAEEGKEGYTRSGEVEAMGGRVKGVYGISVQMGLGGKPVIERFGNIQETDSGAAVVETREPLVDVMEEKDHLVVIAELPGVDEKDIHLNVEGSILNISASTGDRTYRKKVALPVVTDPGSMKSSYRNGVLEIRLTRK